MVFFRFIFIIIFAYSTASIAISISYADDIEQGKQVFRRCAACHYADKNANKVGPTLLNLMGRQAGTVDGYNFTASMVDAGKNGLIWNRDTLLQYLHNPREMVKGTRMASIKLNNDTDIENLISYLKSVETTK